MKKELTNSGIDVLEGAYTGELKRLKSGLTDNSLGMTTAIGGIDCLDLEKNKEIVDAISKEESEYTKVLNKLNSQGLERRGVVPTDVFKQLVAEQKMYTFKTVDAESRVKADLKTFIDKKENGWGLEATAFGLSTFGLMFWVSSANHFKTENIFLFTIFGGIVAFILRALISAALSEIHNYFDIVTAPEVTLINFFRMRSLKKNMKNIFWPERNDTDLTEQFFETRSRGKEETSDAYEKHKKEIVKLNSMLEDTTVAIKTYPAPEKVQTRLRAWHAAGYTPYLVVDEQAFDVVVDGKLKMLLRKAHQILDPMPCVEIGNYTVIIDQYGPFLSEEQIVAYVQKHFSILKNKYGMVENNN